MNSVLRPSATDVDTVPVRISHDYVANLRAEALVLPPGLRAGAVQERRTSWLAPVLDAPVDDAPAYTVFFDLRSDRDHWADARIDLTVVRAGHAAGEFFKTFGHSHPPEGGERREEIYQLLFGRALWVVYEPGGAVCNVINARPGEQCVIPAGMAHITVNVGEQPLVQVSVLGARTPAAYDVVAETRGGPVRVCPEREGYALIPNRHSRAVRVVHLDATSFHASSDGRWLFDAICSGVAIP